MGIVNIFRMTGGERAHPVIPPLGCRALFRYGTPQLPGRKETRGMATPHFTLTALAQQTAAQLGFTLRRWWREKTDPAVLRVEVERRLVGAPPAVAVLTVAIPQSPSARPSRPAVALSPARSQPSTRPTRRATGTRGTGAARKAGGRLR
jgi:hypothetical protein